jgi:hypothetical protein
MEVSIEALRYSCRLRKMMMKTVLFHGENYLLPILLSADFIKIRTATRQERREARPKTIPGTGTKNGIDKVFSIFLNPTSYLYRDTSQLRGESL